jgi:DNA-binding NarL/FixJ family response regulator
MQVVIIDDQRLIREGLAELLSPEIEVIGQAADGHEGLALCRRLRPTVAIVDIIMPVVNGIECTRNIVAAGLPTKVLAMTTYDTDDNVFGMLDAGASGFILKDIEPKALVQALHVIADGGSLLAPTAIRRIIDNFGRPPSASPPHAEALSAREQQVLIEIASGATNEEVAATLSIAVSTVKTHVSHLLDKLQCRDRVQLVILAYESGLVRPGRGPKR